MAVLNETEKYFLADMALHNCLYRLQDDLLGRSFWTWICQQAEEELQRDATQPCPDWDIDSSDESWNTMMINIRNEIQSRIEENEKGLEWLDRQGLYHYRNPAPEHVKIARLEEELPRIGDEYWRGLLAGAVRTMKMLEDRLENAQKELEVYVAMDDDSDEVAPWEVFVARMLKYGSNYDNKAGIWWSDKSKPGILEQRDLKIAELEKELEVVKRQLSATNSHTS